MVQSGRSHVIDDKIISCNANRVRQDYLDVNSILDVVGVASSGGVGVPPTYLCQQLHT
jgi:hypothetical protein